MSSTVLSVALADINEMLCLPTPQEWLEAAKSNLGVLLIDHAHCEKKAASSALNLIYRYADKPDLLLRMSKIAREELRHFEQVLAVLSKQGVQYDHLSPSRYAGEMRKLAATSEPDKLIDMLLIGAIIEARSCERFAALVPVMPDAVAKFFAGLLASEARHYQVYLRLAERYCAHGKAHVQDRLRAMITYENELIGSQDKEFRFHSGIPVG